MQSRSREWKAPLTGGSTRGGAPRGCWRLATLLVALVGLMTLWSGEAAAQSITLGVVGRYKPAPAGEEQPDPRAYNYRNTRPWWISYQDCVENQVFVFPMTINNPRSTLEVWAGTDACDERRGNTSDRGQCWLLASLTATRDVTVEVPVRRVVLQSTSGTVPPPQEDTVCDGSTDSDGSQITFFFFLQDGGKAIAGSTTKWTGGSQGTGFDLIGPAPPTDLDVGMGESQLQVSLSGVTEDPELERIGAYCAVAGAGVEDGEEVFEPAPDANALDAGTDAATDTPTDDTDDGLSPAPATCFTPLLVGGARPDFKRASELGIDLSCGTSNKSSGEVRTKRLENNRTYAIAVAGEDLLGNPGVLSEVKCGTPQELEDFFEKYKFKGGKGGGGFCTTSPAPGAVASGGSTLLALALAMFGIRRTRSKA